MAAPTSRPVRQEDSKFARADGHRSVHSSMRPRTVRSVAPASTSASVSVRSIACRHQRSAAERSPMRNELEARFPSDHGLPVEVSGRHEHRQDLLEQVA